MGETRVDLLHLLEDLRDAYPGALEETILTEIVANSVDSQASLIQIATDTAHGTLTVIDDGSGMMRRELSRYHDIAASTKTRGEGIGFAGVGIKLGLLACKEVLTETRRGKTHVATRWHLASRHRAPWKWETPPPGLVARQGTAVNLILHSALSPLLDPGFVEGAIRRHYQPLMDPAFDQVLGDHYRRSIDIEINGRQLEKQSWRARDIAPVQVRLPRKRKPAAVGYLIRDFFPLPEDQRGIAISTLGKVIKRGWDWVGITPTSPERIGGIIEVPALAASLTLNKGDFIRSGSRGAAYLTYRKAIQEAVSQQLAAWGDAREPAEEVRRRVARPLERDLERVLVDLADDFPLLASLVERRVGGQRRLPIGKADPGAPSHALVAALVATAVERAAEPNEPLPTTSGGEADATPESARADRVESIAGELSAPGSKGVRRPAHYGLSIQFENRADDVELGRLVESTVWINEAHPAHRRAVASRSEGYHVALAVALALAPLAAEPANEHGFVTAFLARWGEALEPAGRPRRQRG